MEIFEELLIRDRKSVFPDQWIYFPETEILFGRIMEPKNFSQRMSPPDKTSLLVEFFCWEKDSIWNSDKKQLSETAVGWLDRHGFINKEDVMDSYLHKERHAYPVYDLYYKEPRSRVMAYLKRFQNLQLVGRAGIFQYNNQDHAMEMGMLAARNIIEGKRIFDPEKVGPEQKYLEGGYVSDT